MLILYSYTRWYRAFTSDQIWSIPLAVDWRCPKDRHHWFRPLGLLGVEVHLMHSRSTASGLISTKRILGLHTSNCSTSQINQRTYGDSWGNSLRTFNTASKCDVDAAIDPHNTLQKTSSHVFYDLLVFKSGELVRNHWKIGDWNVTFWWERQYFFIAGRNVKYSWKWGACVGRRGLWRWILLLLSI